ncbi:MAG: DNA polymerase III subunit gamma/tau [Crocinitomicaceae bacterium]|nr:DNA polymerase III subunit gamma/tau [Crocinitomicaceae bacterium]
MAENFIVSARKYRPDNWDTVVGQKAITTTLQNAIKNNQIAQAYLFCGPRGVGKTSCARIFARAVNGEFLAPDADLSFNVFELDAASNNSVDDIRTIVDSVRIPPPQGRYKIYVIDEVHMLSAAAFNAFLKTLEEPPAHAIFILATTEKHKILPTILSRCQIFDFNRIRVKDMSDHLASIASREGISAEQDALHVIAQKADGAMRDALSIFDQVVAFCGHNLTYQAVIQNLNVLDYDYYFRLTAFILKEDISSSLLLFNEVLNKGFDGHHFITGLGAHFRDLLVCKDAPTVQLLEVSENVAAKYVEQSAAVDVRTIIRGLAFINQCDVQYRTSKHQRLLVELTLMQLCSIPYNTGDNEKKKFRLKPFRSGVIAPSQPIAHIPLTVSTTLPLGSATAPAATEIISPVPETQFPRIPVFGKKGLLTSSADAISIRQIRQRQEVSGETSAAEVIQEIATREYTQGEILEAWSSFADEKLLQNRQVQTAFKVAFLELKENYCLRVAFPSETQQMYFNDYRSELAEFFKSRYDISGLSFQIDIQKNSEVRLSTKTDKEKFDAMKEKNKALEELWRKFQLRVD